MKDHELEKVFGISDKMVFQTLFLITIDYFPAIIDYFLITG